MSIEPYLLWNIVITLVIAPMAWYITRQDAEVKRLQILLNITREEYLKRNEHSEETERLLDHLRQLEEIIHERSVTTEVPDGNQAD